jgi:hypothetical protein
LYGFVGNDGVSRWDYLGLLEWKFDVELKWGDLVDGLRVRARPGGEVQTLEAGSLGLTTIDWKIAGKCKLKKLGTKDIFCFDSFVIEITANIWIRPDEEYASLEQEMWAVRAEFDHAIDFSQWSDETKLKVEEREKFLKDAGVSYLSEQDCMNKNTVEAEGILMGGYDRARDASILRYDVTGMHSWQSENRRD